MIIYKVTNLINSKVYIGQSKYNKDSYYGSGKLILKAIKKYGKENFKKEVLEDNVESFEKLDILEKYYINLYNSIALGYNIADGGRGNKPEQNRKISQHNSGKKMSRKSRQKMSAAHKNKKLSDDHKEKLRLKSIGNKSHSGLKTSSSTKEKISKSLKKLSNTNKWKERSRKTALKIINSGNNYILNLSEQDRSSLVKKASKAALEVTCVKVKIIDTVDNMVIFKNSIREAANFFNLKGTSTIIEKLNNEKLYKKRYKFIRL